MRKTSELEAEISKKEKYRKLYLHYDEKMLHDKIQPALLKILIDFDKICRENNITYFIIAGTLLGAVREKGFIAWDDDIDILMFPSDLKKVKNAIIDSNMDDEYEFLFPEEASEITVDCKFMSKNVSLGNLVGDGKIGHNIYMDVLPIENVPDKSILKSIKSILSRVFMVSYNSMRCLKKYDELLNLMAQDNFELKLNLFLRKVLATPARLLGKNNTLKLIKMVNSYDDETTNYVSIPLGVKMYKGETFPRHVFMKTVFLSFEGYLFSAPHEYVEYLSQRYGKDYMIPPPLRERGIKCFVRRDDWKELI